MFHVELNVDELFKVSKKTIYYFMKSYDEMCSKKELKKKIVQIQILLEKQESFYKLQIVYCGKINFNIEHLFNESFNETIKNFNLDQITLAMVCSKNETTGYDKEEIKKVIYVQDKIVFTNKQIKKSTILTYWDEYMCISLKNKIQLVDIKQFEVSIQNYISQHKPNYPKIRFVFMKDGHQIIEDSLDYDISSCHAIASSLSSIVGNSRNEDFKKKCLDMWHANNPQELEEKVFKKLMYYLENKY